MASYLIVRAGLQYSRSRGAFIIAVPFVTGAPRASHLNNQATMTLTVGLQWTDPGATAEVRAVPNGAAKASHSKRSAACCTQFSKP